MLEDCVHVALKDFYKEMLLIIWIVFEKTV